MDRLTAELEFLQEFDDHELAKLHAITANRDYQPGEVIVKQGTPVDSICVLLTGLVRVTAVMAEPEAVEPGDEEVLVRLEPGEIFGELSFVTGEPPNLSVIAETGCRVAAIDQAALRLLIDRDAAICRKLLFGFMRTMVTRLRRTGRELVLTRYFIRG